MHRFDKTYCSECGGVFGPGEKGYSHCVDHQPQVMTAVQIKGALIADAMDYGRACVDELPKSQQMWLDAIKEKLARLENHAYAEGRKDEGDERAASLLVDAWVASHGSPIPWAKAVEITAVIYKLPEAERQRLLDLN